MPAHNVAEAALLIVAQTLPLTAATYALAVTLNRLNRRFRDTTWCPPVYTTWLDAYMRATDSGMRDYWLEKARFAPATTPQRFRRRLADLLDKVRDFRFSDTMNVVLPSGFSEHVADYAQHLDNDDDNNMLFSTGRRAALNHHINDAI